MPHSYCLGQIPLTFQGTTGRSWSKLPTTSGRSPLPEADGGGELKPDLMERDRKAELSEAEEDDEAEEEEESDGGAMEGREGAGFTEG